MEKAQRADVADKLRRIADMMGVREASNGLRFRQIETTSLPTSAYR